MRKITTLKGFKRELKKLAKKKYHCVQHKITEHHTEEVEHEWRAYIASGDWTAGCDSPEKALKEIKLIIKKLQKGDKK